VLDRIDLVAAQNEEYADRFRAIGVAEGRVHVTGSLKFDGAQTDRANPKTQTLRQLAGFASDDVAFLAGSTQAPEEQLAIEAFQSLSAAHPRLRLVIVPRHPHRFDEVAAILNRSGVAWQRRSEMSSGRWSVVRGQNGSQESGVRNQSISLSTSTAHSPFPTPHSPRVLLVDTVGELGAWWGTATIGFVGGSLFSSRGGQNMIEPAAYGVAICFGPNTQNFRDVVELLLSNHAAVRVTSGAELSAFIRRCLDDANYVAAIGQNASAIVRHQQGATSRTWALIEPLLSSPTKILGHAGRHAA
jgi:3-deoxy-D-manno-octulosonic-acid transferase